MLKVGYIGLGLMGKSMARNVLKAGFPVVVHNRSQAAVDELAAEGATPASTPAEVAAQVDVVFTNLPDSPDVELVALGENGIIEDAKFKTYGCGSAIASSSLLTEWVKGKSLDEARMIKNTDIAEELALPPVKIHCSVLAEDAIKAAIEDYQDKRTLHDQAAEA